MAQGNFSVKVSCLSRWNAVDIRRIPLTAVAVGDLWKLLMCWGKVGDLGRSYCDILGSPKGLKV
jgi:hypothetical protein